MSPKSYFSKGVNPCFWLKNAIFSLFVFCQNKTKKMLNKVCDRKQTFFDYKDNFFQSPKNRIFQKGLTHALAQKI